MSGARGAANPPPPGAIMKSWIRLLFALGAALCAGSAFAQPALTITGITADPATAKPGDTVTFVVAVTNTGTAISTAVDFQIDLENINTGWDIPTLSATVAPTPAIAAGTADAPSSGTFRVTTTIPAQTTDAGPYRAQVRIVSPAASFATGNTVLTITGTPDLQVTALTYPAGTSYVGGDRIDMVLRYRNKPSSNGQSNVPWVPTTAATRFIIEVVLSSNPVFGDADDFLLTFFNHSTRLAADNAEVEIPWTQILPGNFAGSYYVLAKIDARNAITETVENDLSDNGNNIWQDLRAARISIQPSNFPTIYWASSGSNGYSDNPSISADGRYVAFAADATNLIASDTNALRDVFLYDNQTRLVRRLSVSQQGVQTNGASNNPSISGNARYVAFSSEATNLISGDTNGFSDIFVVDTITGSLARESVGSGGVQANNSSFKPALSSDGRYLVFESTATNLVSPGTAVGVSHIYRRDRTTGTTVLVSRSSSGAAGNGLSTQAAISADGQFVAFASDATNLVEGDNNAVRDVFVRDLAAGTTIRASVGSAGEANGPSRSPSISADGRHVAFASTASNLAASDLNGISDIFGFDRVTGSVTRVTISVTGGDPSDPSDANFRLGSLNPSISASGRYIAFSSLADNLTDGDEAGEYFALDPNRSLDVFVVDRDVSDSGTFDTTGNTRIQMVSKNRFGMQTLGLENTQSTSASDIVPAISGDGRWVAFPTDAENTGGLIHGATNRTSPDGNSSRDVVVFDRRINALPDAGVVPTVTISSPANNGTYVVNNELNVTAQANTTIGSIASVQFFVNGVSLGAADTDFPYVTTWRPTGIGTYNLSAVVTDSFGNQGVSSPVNVTVGLGGAPRVTIAAPTDQSTITVRQDQTLRAEATSPAGTISSVQFLANGVPVGAPARSAPFTTTWTPTAEGVYRITAVATDNAGLTTTSDAVSVIAFPNGGSGDAIFSGNYAGAGETGRFAIMNVGGREAVLVGFSNTTPSRVYFVSNVEVDSGGGFTATDSSGRSILSATVNPTGVTGTLDGGRLTLIGATTQGSGTVVPSGYYAGSLTGRPASVVSAVVGADGSIFVFGTDGGSFRDAGAGTIGSNGAFNISTPSGNRFTGTADSRTGFVSGTLVGGPGGTFTAARASGASFADGFLRNLSTRGQVGTGSNILIAGFVVGGTTPKNVLLRAIGPSLTPLGVNGALADPQLQLFSGSNLVATNDNWGGDTALANAASSAGAFALAATSRDAVIRATLQPGNYTAQISGVGATTGVALFELYDLDTPEAFSTQRLANVATRGMVGTGTAQLIAGFIVSGTTPKKVLIRAAGPALGALGVSGALADPMLRLVRSSGGTDTLVRENDNWEVGNDSVLVNEAVTRIQTFPFTAGSRDAVLLLSLPPGNYSAQVTGAASSTGVALIEVYEVP